MNKIKTIILTLALVFTPTFAEADVFIYGGGQLVGVIPSYSVFRVISFSNRVQAMSAYHRLLKNLH